MTDPIPNREMVVYALSLLGGDSKPIHTEDIAVKCHDLFPASFSWTKYPDFPDKDIVRVALTDARKAQYGALVEGRTGQQKGHSAKTKRRPASDGWMLTSAGAVWAREKSSVFESLGAVGELKSHRQWIPRQLSKVRKHHLFVAYLRNAKEFDPQIGDLADLARCRVDAAQSVWEGRFDALERKALAAGQDDIVDFTKRCREAYDRDR